MAKRKANAKAEKLPPVGTRWRGINGNDYYTMTANGPEYRCGNYHAPAPLSGPDRDWKVVDANYGPRIPPAKPARDSMAMRRKAVAGVLGGWVVGTKKLHSFGITHADGTIDANVKVTITAENYAKFLADPSCNGAAT